MFLSVFPYLLGSERVDVENFVGENYPEKVRALNRTGFKTVFRSSESESIVSLAGEAVAMLNQPWLDTVDTVIGVSSETVRSPHWVHIVNSGTPGAERRALFGLQDACTGFVGALSLASALVSAGSAQRVLILNGDTYTKRIHDNPGLSMLFSDAVSVAVVESEVSSQPGDKVTTSFEIIYSGSRNLPNSHESLGIVNDALTMHGAKVFQFASSILPELIADASAKSDTGADGIEWYVHQGSALVVSEIEAMLSVPDGSLFRSAQYGNTVGSSIPIQLFDFPPSKNFIGLLGFGMGLTARILIARVAS